jgi:hypothetical protein
MYCQTRALRFLFWLLFLQVLLHLLLPKQPNCKSTRNTQTANRLLSSPLLLFSSFLEANQPAHFTTVHFTLAICSMYNINLIADFTSFSNKIATDPFFWFVAGAKSNTEVMV